MDRPRITRQNLTTRVYRKNPSPSKLWNPFYAWRGVRHYRRTEDEEPRGPPIHERLFQSNTLLFPSSLSDKREKTIDGSPSGKKKKSWTQNIHRSQTGKIRQTGLGSQILIRGTRSPTTLGRGTLCYICCSKTITLYFAHELRPHRVLPTTE